MAFKDNGKVKIKEADDANIPVNCHLHEPSEENSRWSWSACNFCPRKHSISEGAYELEADSKEEILEKIKKYVVPLYKVALSNLEKTGNLYYWSKESL